VSGGFLFQQMKARSKFFNLFNQCPGFIPQFRKPIVEVRFCFSHYIILLIPVCWCLSTLAPNPQRFIVVPEPRLGNIMPKGAKDITAVVERDGEALGRWFLCGCSRTYP